MALLQQPSSPLRSPEHLLRHLSRHLRPQSTTGKILTASAATLSLVAAWLVADYRAWKALGTGGTPATPAGYWRMTKIRINRLFSRDSLRDVSSLSTAGPRFLHIALPDRTKHRPRIQSRTMPQRQHAEGLLDPVARERLHAMPRKFCAEHPTLLRLDLSTTEGGSTDAIYARPDLPNRPASASHRILKDEIAHVHPSEDSLHVWVSQADARKIIEAGWGERFPLTPMRITPPGLLFVYAPRDMGEVDIVEEIVRASVAYVTGEKV